MALNAPIQWLKNVRDFWSFNTHLAHLEPSQCYLRRRCAKFSPARSEQYEFLSGVCFCMTPSTLYDGIMLIKQIPVMCCLFSDSVQGV